MSSLDLQLEGLGDCTITDKTFAILRDFLQPDTALTLEGVAQSILDLLPEKAPHSTDVWLFGEVCIELAEQIPYGHPSQIKLTALLEHLGKFAKFTSVTHAKLKKGWWYHSHRKVGKSLTDAFLARFGKTKSRTIAYATSTLVERYHSYQRLGESLRDSLNFPDPENISLYVNFHAFAANLFDRVFSGSPTWAIWAQRDAHEERRDKQDIVRDAYVSAAAQWIFWYGQSLFKQVLFAVPESDLRLWSPGDLYDGKADLSLDRWHFWRDGYKAVASGQRGEEQGFGQECQDLAARAADIMDCLENNMTF
ncbi:MAG: hypothetical protein M4579_000404 [Chaenotheca gracillima]|nr:MAG: hypothetical protein M4579_000404 [Chaenotheca gracillima]